MIFLLALIPATALTVAGYVALFLSHRSDGGLKTFGRYLGIWAFVLATLVALGGMFAAGHMRAHAGMWGPHAGMYCPWTGDGPQGPRPDVREMLREPPPPPAPPGAQRESVPAGADTSHK
ncbi:MAG: hypothetical protein KGJ68_02485 [Gammaproteobacteria bacterium]|nr:hypothetical protein [Gammaproteobacteria bacterium]